MNSGDQELTQQLGMIKKRTRTYSTRIDKNQDINPISPEIINLEIKVVEVLKRYQNKVTTSPATNQPVIAAAQPKMEKIYFAN
jgi:hypothetical protein